MPENRVFEDALGNFEPQRQFQWTLQVPALPFWSGKLELALRTGVLPTESNEEIEIPFFNGRNYFAGKAMYEAGTFAFIDYVDQNTAKLIGTWRDLVHNPLTHRIGYAIEYKFDADLILYDPHGDPLRQWKIKGLWPQQATYGNLDYGASDVVQIDVNFRYDRAYRGVGLESS